MKLLFDGNPERPEIVLLDSPNAIRKLGQLLLNLDKEIELSAEQVYDYPDLYNLRAIVFKINDNKQGDDLIYISLAKDDLVIEGTPIALGKVGQSLIDCFDENTPDKYHIHLDYFPGNVLVAPTKYNLVIACKR